MMSSVVVVISDTATNGKVIEQVVMLAHLALMKWVTLSRLLQIVEPSGLQNVEAIPAD